MTLRKVWATRVNGASAETFVGKRGTIFFSELTGALRISDGTTPGGQPLTLVSSDFNFQFGDFVATTPGDGSATLSSVGVNQDIAIVSNGTGAIDVVGDFHIHRTQDYDPENVDHGSAVFAVKSDGQIQMKVPLADVSAAALEIIGNDSGFFLAPTQTGVILHVTGNSGLVSRNYFDANANYVILAGRRYNGTQLAPRRVLNNETLLRIVSQGAVADASNSDATFGAFGPARISFYANEDQTPTAQGGRIAFEVTKNGFAADGNGTNTITVASIDAQTGLTATKLNGKLIRATRNAGTIAAGGTLTINFATDDIVYCVWGDGITLAYSNFTAGSVVRILAAKSAGSGNDPINLDGVTAANVSTGATITANYAAATTACIELTCTGTTIGSVYVKV